MQFIFIISQVTDQYTPYLPHSLAGTVMELAEWCTVMSCQMKEKSAMGNMKDGARMVEAVKDGGNGFGAGIGERNWK